MIQTKFQNLLTCILYTYDKINIHILKLRLFNLFRRLRSWRCEGGAIEVIWRWTTYRSLRGRANAISFFIYFDYFFFHLIVFFLFIACWFWFYMYLSTFHYFLSISKRWGTGVLLFYIGWKVFLFVGGGYLNTILIFFKWGE